MSATLPSYRARHRVISVMRTQVDRFHVVRLVHLITGENGGDSLSSPNTLDAAPDLGQTRGPVFSRPRAGAPETGAVRPSLVALLEAPEPWHARRLLQLYAIHDAGERVGSG